MRIYRAPEVWNVPVPHGGRCGTALKIAKRWGRRPRRPAHQILHSPLELTMDGTIEQPFKPLVAHTVAPRLEMFDMIRSEDRQALNPHAECEDHNGQSPSPRGLGETLQAQGDRYREQRKDMNLIAGSPPGDVGVMPGREKRVARKQRDQHPHDIGTVTLPELMHSADRDC